MIKKKSLDYSWMIIGACFALCFTGLGLCSGSKGLFLVAITEALNIPRGLYSISDSLRYITTSITNLFFGAMVVKFGTKKLIGMGMGALALSCLVNSLAQTVAGIYLGGILLGFGLTFGGTTIVGYVVKRWCKKNQGTILGLVMCANALGTALSAPWISRMIYNGDPFGYRSAYRLISFILLAVGTVLVLVFRDAPKEEVLSQDGKARKDRWDGISIKQALHLPCFYIVCACVFCTGAVLQSVTGVAAAHMKDQGIHVDFVATVTSIHALSLALFKFLTGLLYDKKGLKFTVLVCDIAAMVMILLLAVVSPSPAGCTAAVVYAILSGLALPLETVMLPLIADDLFGEKDFSRMLGIFVSVNTAGFAVGPLVSNLCFDAIGTYRPVFFVYAAIMLAVSVTFLLAVRRTTALRTQICKY